MSVHTSFFQHPALYPWPVSCSSPWSSGSQYIPCSLLLCSCQSYTIYMAYPVAVLQTPTPPSGSPAAAHNTYCCWTPAACLETQLPGHWCYTLLQPTVCLAVDSVWPGSGLWTLRWTWMQEWVGQALWKINTTLFIFLFEIWSQYNKLEGWFRKRKQSYLPPYFTWWNQFFVEKGEIVI